MAEQATSAKRTPSNGEDGETAELLQELARAKEEVLRLRDLLIGKDAELGAMSGRLAELEAGAGRLVNAAASLQARVPRFVRTGAAGLRKRRSRG